jgi:hypothetical protein
MSVAIPELIALELVERLESSYEFESIERPNRDGSSLSYKHRSIQVVQGEAARVPELDCQGNPPALAYRVAFELKCVCRDSPAEDVALATNPNDLAAKAVAAVTGTDLTWYTMGGNSIDSEIGSLTPFDSAEGEFNGMAVPIEITYRVSENNPYNVRA